MQSLSKLEDWLAGIYKATPKLSDSSKKSIVNIAPWLAVILGALQAWGAWALWDWGRKVDSVYDAFNTYFGATIGTNDLGVVFWVSLVLVVIDAVLLLAAFPGLKKRAKSGWNLIFYSALLGIVYGIFSAFNDYGGGGSLIIQAISSIVILYFLFQIRDQYSGSRKSTPVDNTPSA